MYGKPRVGNEPNDCRDLRRRRVLQYGVRFDRLKMTKLNANTDTNLAEVIGSLLQNMSHQKFYFLFHFTIRGHTRNFFITECVERRWDKHSGNYVLLDDGIYSGLYPYPKEAMWLSMFVVKSARYGRNTITHAGLLAHLR